MRTTIRLFYAALLAAMLYLALTPGPWGQIIESSEERHALAFAILPLLSCLAWPALGVVLQFLFYAALGGAIELAQLAMHAGRNAEWNDWFVDLLVAAGALVIGRVVMRAVLRHRRSHVPPAA